MKYTVLHNPENRLQKLTPIRGRKRMKEVCYINWSKFTEVNPDKGTETDNEDGEKGPGLVYRS